MTADVSEPAFLSIDLLEDLRRVWIDQGAPLADALAPGLSHAEMDELTAPLGLLVPPEAPHLVGMARRGSSWIVVGHGRTGMAVRAS